MGARPYAVTDGMRRLSRVSTFGDALPDEAVEFRKRRAVAGEARRLVENFEQQIEELVVLLRELARADVLGQIVPVAVNADPYLKQRGLVLLDGAVAGGGESRNALARPDQREGARHLHLAFVADAAGVDEAFEHRRHVAFLHAGTDALADEFQPQRGQLVGQAHALDFLRGLDGAGFGQQRRRICHLPGDGLEGVEVSLRERRGLADHAVTGLRAHAQLDADSIGEAALSEHAKRQIEAAHLRWARITLVVAFEQADVLRPGRAFGIGPLWLDHAQRGLALGREDDRVVALHAPVIREIDDVVRRAADQRGQALILHHGADAGELGGVDGVRHFSYQSSAVVRRQDSSLRSE